MKKLLTLIVLINLALPVLAKARFTENTCNEYCRNKYNIVDFILDDKGNSQISGTLTTDKYGNVTFIDYNNNIVKVIIINEK